MFKVALSISILIAIVFPIGSRILPLFVSNAELLEFLGPWKYSFVQVGFRYFVVAGILYAGFRAIELNLRFDLYGRGNIKLLTANWVFMAYTLIRTYASTIPGGGVGLVVSFYGLFIRFPCWILIIWGLIQILNTRRNATSALGNLPTDKN